MIPSLKKHKPVLGWDNYAISPEGELVQLRKKTAIGFDLKGRYVYLDDGKGVCKMYLQEILAATFGRKATSEAEDIVAFLEEVSDALAKEIHWEIKDYAVEITLPIKLPQVKVVTNILKLYLLADVHAIFNPEGKYGKTFYRRA